jgi:zinc D-Ala-D-Ala carboxypeptidase
MSARPTVTSSLLALAIALLIAGPGAAVRAAEASELPAEWTSPLRVALAAVSPRSRDLTLADSPTGSATVALSEPVPAAAPLPPCEYKDELTRFHRVKHWRKTLLDTTYRVKRSYKPWDLVSVSRAGIRGSGLVRAKVIPDLAALAAAARKAGKPLAVRSAYRSYDSQVAVFDSWVRRSGRAQALKFSARPGHSEHQLGTTVDFTTAPGTPLSGSFGTSPAGLWLASNGWKYGFVMSYPKGQRRVSCYGYEPWHWRYVGHDLARRIHESGQVPRRFLWENYETAP